MKITLNEHLLAGGASAHGAPMRVELSTEAQGHCAADELYNGNV